MAVSTRSPARAGGLKRVLFVGDLGRVRFHELTSGYVISPGYVPNLAALLSMIKVPADWGNWDVLFVDSRSAGDAEIAAFFVEHKAELLAAQVRVVVLLDPRHAHLGPTLGAFARLVRQEDTTETISLALTALRSGSTRKTTHVLVVSAKGGTGKTSVALAVAEYLPVVQVGWKVTVVDADLFDGNVALSLGVHERARSILELATAVRHEGMTPEMLERYLTQTPWGLDLLAAPDSSLYKDGHVDPGVIDQAYDVLQARGSDIVVTDAPPDIRQGTPLARAFFNPERLPATIVLVILGPRKFERDGFSRMADYLRAKGALDRAWLVYVQTRPFRRDKDRDLVRGLDKLAAEHGLRGVAGQLPYDPVVEDAEEQAVPFWAVKPQGAGQWLGWKLRGGSPFQRSAAALARRVIEISKEGGTDGRA